MDFYDNQHSSPSHDRWLISWADFMTLMFAVFVVLFAAAATDKNTAKEISQAVMNALETGNIRFISHGKTAPRFNETKADGNGKGSDSPQQQTVVGIVPSLKVLSEKFQDEISRGHMEIHLEARGLVISLREAAFFASGDAVLNRDCYPTLDKIATVILSVPNRANLEGHTDDVPIHNSRFASNWELSAARSIAMLDLLTARSKIPRGRLAISGYADTVPLEPNSDEEGRARNRRVDVVILNELAPQTGAHTSH